MIGLVLLSVAATAVLIGAIAIVLYDLSQFKERTIDDVPDFLRPLEEETERSLFDPDVDAALRLSRVPAIFRRKQRIRLDLAAQYYRCRNYRVRVLLQWANTEQHDIHLLCTEDEYTDEALRNLSILCRKGEQFCRLVRVVRARIWVFRILLRLDKFHLLPTPDVAPLREIGFIDMMRLYKDIKRAAVAFALTYGEDQSEELRFLL